MGNEIAALQEWIREPDYSEDFSLDEMIDWIERRPIAAVARLAAETPIAPGNAPRHLISGSDAAEDDDLPVCTRCGAIVHDPCTTDEKQAGCELPDFCFPPEVLLDRVVREREDYNGKHQSACLEIERLRKSLEEIYAEVGTSTKASMIARNALGIEIPDAPPIIIGGPHLRRE